MTDLNSVAPERGAATHKSCDRPYTQHLYGCVHAIIGHMPINFRDVGPPQFLFSDNYFYHATYIVINTHQPMESLSDSAVLVEASL